MKNSKILILTLSILTTLFVLSGFKNHTQINTIIENKIPPHQTQTINMFVTHGHCSTPFSGVVNNLKLDLSPRSDLGHPISNMKLSFEIDPNTFVVCANNNLTKSIRTPGLFMTEKNEKITFRTKNSYKMGVDWYQLNGLLSIKGVYKNVTFFLTGIRKPKENWPTSLVLEGQINLFDWEIDYDNIVNGQSYHSTTKRMHFNMRVKINK